MGRFAQFSKKERDLFHDLLVEEAQNDDSDEEVQASATLAAELAEELDRER
jgi:hypothetical protein